MALPRSARGRGGRGTRAVYEREGVAFVYLLRCADASLYPGWTVDLDRRLAAHRAGTASKYTRSRRPVALAWSRRCRTRTAARKLEARLKALSRRGKLAVVVAGGRARP